MPISPQIRKMITDGSSDGQIKQQAIQEGMRTLTKAAIDEALNGSTTVDELLRVVDLRAE
jgi:type II secretory ATPase GspE/PulE/Tfp pilus assembly ATPase PilB-like protein